MRARLLCHVSICCVASLVAVDALADGSASSIEAARLFEEAQTLMAADDYAPACAKLQESQQLDPQLGTQLHLAHCFEKRGLTASAYRSFEAAARLAAQRNAASLVEPREAVAWRRAAHLRPLLSSVRVQLAERPAGLRITLDGEPFEVTSADTPIDPGLHLLQAHAPDRPPWSREFKIGAQPAKLIVEVPSLPPAATAAVGEPPARALRADSAAEAPSESTPLTASIASNDSASSPRRTLGYVALSTGAVGLVIGAAMGLARNAKVAQLEKYCDLERGTCGVMRGDETTRARIGSLEGEVHTFATAASLGLAIGGAVAAAGLVLLLTSPEHETREVSLGIGPLGISLAGRADVF